MDTFPGYKVDGKTFKTVRGLFAYMMKKHAPAASMSGIGQFRTLTVYDSGKDVIAQYQASAPVIEQPITLTIL